MFVFARVIGVGEGSGDLLSVSLELADKCHHKVQMPLAVATLNLTVKTAGSDNGLADWKTERKKEGRKRRKEKKHKQSIMSVDMGDISEMLSNIPLSDENSRDPNPFLQQKQDHHAYMTGYGHEATTLEVGMYILLGVFCVAITVFMASCFVYASKYNNQPGFQVEKV